MLNQDAIKEELLEGTLYQAIKMLRKRFKAVDLPKFWHSQIATTTYWWISMSDNPWQVVPDVFSTNLHTIWDDRLLPICWRKIKIEILNMMQVLHFLIETFFN